jgi:hypothetical protein
MPAGFKEWITRRRRRRARPSGRRPRSSVPLDEHRRDPSFGKSTQQDRQIDPPVLIDRHAKDLDRPGEVRRRCIRARDDERRRCLVNDP